MQNFQYDLQGLGIDPFQVGMLAPINPQILDLRLHGGMHCGGMHCGGVRCGGFHCGGFHCGGFHCGGFRCGGFSCFNCFNCVGVVVI